MGGRGELTFLYREAEGRTLKAKLRSQTAGNGIPAGQAASCGLERATEHPRVFADRQNAGNSVTCCTGLSGEVWESQRANVCKVLRTTSSRKEEMQK